MGHNTYSKTNTDASLNSVLLPDSNLNPHIESNAKSKIGNGNDQAKDKKYIH